MLGDDDIFNLTLYCLRWHTHAKWGDSEPIVGPGLRKRATIHTL